MHRELADAGHALRVRYTAESDETSTVAWAMHLLLDIDADTVQLPPDVPVRVDSRFGAAEDVLSVSKPEQWTQWGEIRPKMHGIRGGWGAELFTRPDCAYQVQARRGAQTLSFEDTPAEPTFGLCSTLMSCRHCPGSGMSVWNRLSAIMTT